MKDTSKQPLAYKVGTESTFSYQKQWNAVRFFIKKTLWPWTLHIPLKLSPVRACNLKHFCTTVSLHDFTWTPVLWTGQIRLFELLHFGDCRLIVRFMNESDWTSDYSRPRTNRKVRPLWLKLYIFFDVCRTATCIQHTENVISQAQADRRGESTAGLGTLKDCKGTGADPILLLALSTSPAVC